MIDKMAQFGFPGLDVKGITIHNTSNALSAYDNFMLMKKSKGSAGTHYFVDGDEIIQVMPLDWCVYHTGKAVDWACKHTIAIEICNSKSVLPIYMAAEEKAVGLIKQLMEDYNVPTRRLYFHKDFNRTTYCPHRILELYGDKQEFIRRYF